MTIASCLRSLAPLLVALVGCAGFFNPDDPPPPVEPPTQVALDRQAFSAALTIYRQQSAAFAIGLVDAVNVTAAKAMLVKAFQPGFEDLLPTERL